MPMYAEGQVRRELLLSRDSARLSSFPHSRLRLLCASSQDDSLLEPSAPHSSVTRGKSPRCLPNVALHLVRHGRFLEYLVWLTPRLAPSQ
jgi:hypothetical protein